MSPAILIVPLVAAGLAGTVVAVAEREQDDAFALRQQALSPVQGDQLARVVATAPNPIPGSGGRRAERATCRSGGTGALRNPWTCRVEYPSGDVVRYRVVVRPDRSFRGSNPDGSLVVYGCCAGRAG